MKNPSKPQTQILLLSIPITVSIFLVTDALWNTLTGKPLVGIDPTVGAIAMIASWLVIPFAILRKEKENGRN